VRAVLTSERHHQGSWRAANLRALHLAGNARLTDASIKYLRDEFGALEELGLSGCVEVA
jgi:hypothetical protein